MKRKILATGIVKMKFMCSLISGYRVKKRTIIAQVQWAFELGNTVESQVQTTYQCSGKGISKVQENKVRVHP
jgi:hypothetical protein